jgi:spore coat polysaccharide biosynthesis protein SpsF
MASVTVVVQARMGSTRLTGKVLLELGGRPMLALLLARVQAGVDGSVVVATSTKPADDAVARVATELDVPVVRGPEHDVLARFALAGESFPADHVVRLTADCPLTDPNIVTEAVERHVRLRADYTSNTLARTYPDGLDVEVMTSAVLRRAAQEATTEDEREHVTPFVYRRPRRHRLAALCSSLFLGAERWTVDTAADVERLRTIVAGLDDPVTATWREVLDVAGETAVAARGEPWLRPICWNDVSFRRAWNVVVDDDTVGSVVVDVYDGGEARWTFDGDDALRTRVEPLLRAALGADKQVTVLS